MLAVREVAGAMPDALGADGTFVLQNNRISQSVPHLHFHVVPRRTGDRLFSDALVWRRVRYAGEDQMRDVAAKLARAFSR
jgi:histidine triad (HIT) family protein